MRKLIFLLLLLIASNAAFSADTAHAVAPTQIFTVNSDDDTDDGVCNGNHCSLREAINAANTLNNFDVIGFNFAAATAILPTSPLPDIIAPVTIDGTLNNASHCPTLNDSADLLITLSGFNAGVDVTGLTLVDGSSGSTIRGLNIILWDQHGIYIEEDSDDNTIQCNHIGLQNSDVVGFGNGVDGVRVDGDRVLVGGSTAAERNVVADNDNIGITLDYDSQDSEVKGNYVGTSRDGLTAVGNGWGVYIYGDDSTVGDTTAAERNIISGNRQQGVGIDHGDGNTILDNYIGVGVDGSTPLPNTVGIIVRENAYSNIIGTSNGYSVVTNNLISGIRIEANYSRNNAIRFNSVYNNGGLGIDLLFENGTIGQISVNDALDADGGPNRLQNYPVLSSMDIFGRIQATMPVALSTDYTIDVYQNSDCDPSGHGEGELHLDSFIVPSANGVAFIDDTITPAPAVGSFVSATATDPDGNTSEFSNCIPVTEKTFTVNTEGNNGDYNTSDGACDSDGSDIEEQCTLRAVIEQVNALSGGPYRVTFDYGTAVNIAVTPPLPAITTPIILDATTNDGASCPTSDSPANLRVSLGGDFLPAGSHIFTLDAGSGGSEIRGFLISGAPSDGIRVRSNNNVIACNRILSNGDDGVHVTGDNNRIGAISTHADRNVISGNDGSGVQLSDGATDNKVRGNFIGTDDSGSGVNANNTGIYLVQDVTGSTIGGTIPLRRNIVAGNSSHGIFIERMSASNTIIGNYVGVDATGSAEMPNGGAGIRIENSAANTIGGSEDGEFNVISGNGGHGVLLVAANNTSIVRNLIGTDSRGMLDFGNASAGVRNEQSESVIIGGFLATDGNIISGNGGSGIVLIDGTNLNSILNNRIGVAINGAPLGNGLHGIHLDATTVSGVVFGNTISHNGRDGVRVDPLSIFNSITVNSISNNGWLGIDLGEDGVTANDDAPDGDGGANDLQNYPVIVSADSSTNQVTLSLETVRNVDNMRIDLYRSSSCDDSGHGQGEEWLELLVVSTDANGLANITATVDGLTGGDFLTATATNPDNNFSTSEFSLCYQVATPTAVSFSQQISTQHSDQLMLILAMLTLLSGWTLLSRSAACPLSFGKGLG